MHGLVAAKGMARTLAIIGAACIAQRDGAESGGPKAPEPLWGSDAVCHPAEVLVGPGDAPVGLGVPAAGSWTAGAAARRRTASQPGGICSCGRALATLFSLNGPIPSSQIWPDIDQT